MIEQNTDPDFDLEQFLPYMLNQAAEVTSRSFQAVYRDLYGMTRTQWRVMANLGKFGAMTARDICLISHIEKTKVSRAVSALESAGFLRRNPSEDDRRAEILNLTEKGRTAFRDLGHRANEYDRKLRADLGDRISSELVKSLQLLMKL
ncbi:MarR family winged helix-turn-helix transcriptional regulator (plasmid) [Rhizobium sp. WSM1274]|uniref:MarR family winged helix-turn-helix transcriptional regulator n=1 Tax=Rhizobium sp. WSM1274 TaxID=3138254 RepID=UPI0021A302BB|nr:MarR family winged helix-turn-helix transcriptional regulator [Rhizobium leguminosarum]UWU30870.1 MarR family winged helix-turn-helix transcriptional regulator [Rhizobium leguminosarum bv. viciae]